jgi:hypothetical protein
MVPGHCGLTSEQRQGVDSGFNPQPGCVMGHV